MYFLIYLAGYWQCRMAFKVQRLPRFSTQTLETSLLYQNQGTLKSQPKYTVHQKSWASVSELQRRPCLVISASCSAVLVPARRGLLALGYGVSSAHRTPCSSSGHVFPQRSDITIGAPYLRWSSDKKK